MKKGHGTLRIEVDCGIQIGKCVVKAPLIKVDETTNAKRFTVVGIDPDRFAQISIGLLSLLLCLPCQGRSRIHRSEDVFKNQDLGRAVPLVRNPHIDFLFLSDNPFVFSIIAFRINPQRVGFDILVRYRW